jgi:hypothetical protein
MAVNDSILTEKVRLAEKYFRELHRATESDTIRVDNDGHLSTMGYVVTHFIDEENRKKIIGKLNERKCQYPAAVSDGTGSRCVVSMIQGYAIGRRDFGRHYVENAARLCNALLNYVNFLEAEMSE